MQAPPHINSQKARNGFWLFAVALGLNLLVVLVSLPLYQVPPGTDIRPMMFAVYCAAIALAALCVVPVAIGYMIRRRRFLWPALALLLGLTPWFVSGAMLQHAMGIHHLRLSP
jgi:hypothetical protein